MNMQCVKIVSALQKLLDSNDIDNGHGIDHVTKVLCHANNAIAVSKTVKNPMHLDAIRYAALLHDADDRKFFPDSVDCQNARMILEQILPGESSMHNLVIKIISLVSCSSNGNSFDNIEECDEWMYIVRICDRLEAIGPIGVARAYAYGIHTNSPLFLETTPRATTMEELNDIATPERFMRYLDKKQSLSIIDHFYDKLLHIGTNEALGIVDNSYLSREAQERHQYMVDYVLKFGKTGVVE